MVKASDQIRCGDVYWVNPEPTIGSEIQKTRPALVISPSDMNAVLPRVIVAPIASKGQALGCRPEVSSMANRHEFYWIRFAALTRSGYLENWMKSTKHCGTVCCCKCLDKHKEVRKVLVARSGLDSPTRSNFKPVLYRLSYKLSSMKNTLKSWRFFVLTP